MSLTLTKSLREALAAHAREVGCCRVAVLAPIFEDEDASTIETLRVVAGNGSTYTPTPTSATVFNVAKGRFEWTRSEYSRGRVYQHTRESKCPPVSQSDGSSFEAWEEDMAERWDAEMERSWNEQEYREEVDIF